MWKLLSSLLLTVLSLSLSLLLVATNAPMPVDAQQLFTRMANMNVNRSDIEAISIGPLTYVLGGQIVDQPLNTTLTPFTLRLTNSFEVFDVRTNVWTMLASAPRNRTRYGAETVNGLIFYIGGRDEADNVVTEVDVYNTTSRTWSTLDDQNGVTGLSDVATFTIGSKIYVVGGWSPLYEPLDTTIICDTSVTPFRFLPSNVTRMPTARGDAGGVAIGGYGYVFGGWNYDALPHAELERYNPADNSWTTLTPMPSARGDTGYAVVDGLLFLMGGETKSGAKSVPVGNIEMYNPKKDAWTTIGSLAITRFRFTGGSDSDLDYLLLIGGQGAQTPATTNPENMTGVFPVLGDVYLRNVSADVAAANAVTPSTPTTNGATVAATLQSSVAVLPVLLASIVALLSL